MDYLDKLKIEDLEGTSRNIAEVIGFENFKNLVKNFGGNFIYISKAETLSKDLRNKEIMNCFENGDDYITLSKKFNVSQTTIKNIIRECLSHRNYVSRNQIRMDELNGK